ncbi:hypothetical protein C8R45DRAFT_1214917 [Mycena sanguinolenta]|nr:hypothetical protein C8R45DRAFT_1214917 [Mycena sanguinolenta]
MLLLCRPFRGCVNYSFDSTADRAVIDTRLANALDFPDFDGIKGVIITGDSGANKRSSCEDRASLLTKIQAEDARFALVVGRRSGEAVGFGRPKAKKNGLVPSTPQNGSQRPGAVRGGLRGVAQEGRIGNREQPEHERFRVPPTMIGFENHPEIILANRGEGTREWDLVSLRRADRNGRASASIFFAANDQKVEVIAVEKDGITETVLKSFDPLGTSQYLGFLTLGKKQNFFADTSVDAFTGLPTEYVCVHFRPIHKKNTTKSKLEWSLKQYFGSLRLKHDISIPTAAQILEIRPLAHPPGHYDVRLVDAGGGKYKVEIETKGFAKYHYKKYARDGFTKVWEGGPDVDGTQPGWLEYAESIRGRARSEA